MPRCQMCDHCDEVPSIYEASLAQRGNAGRVRYYPELGMDACWRCYRESHTYVLEDTDHNLPAFVVPEWDEVSEGELPPAPHDEEDFS
jgi:hypothetical protein